MEGEDKEYIKGFNHGYFLAKYKPELIKKIIITKNQNDYIKGLNDGEIIFKKSKMKSRFQELKNIHARKNREQGKDLEK